MSPHPRLGAGGRVTRSTAQTLATCKPWPLAPGLPGSWTSATPMSTGHNGLFRVLSRAWPQPSVPCRGLWSSWWAHGWSWPWSGGQQSPGLRAWAAATRSCRPGAGKPLTPLSLCLELETQGQGARGWVLPRPVCPRRTRGGGVSASSIQGPPRGPPGLSCQHHLGPGFHVWVRVHVRTTAGSRRS